MSRLRKQRSDAVFPTGTDGAPVMTFRLEPDLREWVRLQGGAAWLRRMVRLARAMCLGSKCKDCGAPAERIGRHDGTDPLFYFCGGCAGA